MKVKFNLIYPRILKNKLFDQNLINSKTVENFIKPFYYNFLWTTIRMLK